MKCRCKFHLKSSLRLLAGFLVLAGLCLLFAGVLLVIYSSDMSRMMMLAISNYGML
jgi:hypothetical protein